MSQRHAVQDATGVIAVDESGDILIAAGATVPAAASSGYASGALFIDTDGGAVYVNEDTSSPNTSDFQAISS